MTTQAPALWLVDLVEEEVDLQAQCNLKRAWRLRAAMPTDDYCSSLHFPFAR
jgi:hypothetical protein